MPHPDLPSQEDLESEIKDHVQQFSPKAYRRMKADKTVNGGR